MTILSLDNLSVVGVSPVEFVDIAADAGFDAISPVGGNGNQLPLPSHRLQVGDPETMAMKRRLSERGIAVNNLDGIVVMPEMDWSDIDRMIEVALYLDARAGVTLIFDPEPARGVENFQRLCEMARTAGLPMLLEFAGISSVPSLAAAVDYVDRHVPEVGIVIDALHLNFAGETAEDVARLAPGRRVTAQICDSKAGLTLEEYEVACMFDRAAPGDGALPLAAFLSALPEGTPVGVEAPLRALIDQGVSAAHRARFLADKAQACLRAAGRG